MPSFFEGLKRLATGQPVFKQGEDGDGASYKPHDGHDTVPAESTSDQAAAPQGPKERPEVVLGRVQCRDGGHGMELDVEIKNNSQQSIFVDKLMILGTRRELDYVMRPGEEREFTVYDGPKLNHRNYNTCELQYRNDSDGDYFSSLHLVEFESQDSDGNYAVRNIRFTPPIKDI